MRIFLILIFNMGTKAVKVLYYSTHRGKKKSVFLVRRDTF